MNQSDRKIALMIIGSEKSGTTSLFRLLADHPEVHTHEQREMTWFRTDEYAEGWNYARKKYFGEADDGRVLIAKDVFAMYSYDALERLHAHNPDIRVVAMLRNPVDRAYSAYWYSRRRGREPVSDFAKALDAEKERLAYDPVQNLANGYLANGFYAIYLKQAIEIFGRERVRICFIEDLKTDANALCREIFASIGVDADYKPSVTTWQNKSGMAKSEGMARLMNKGLKSRGLMKRLAKAILSPELRVKLKHALLRMNEKPFTLPPMSSDVRQYLVESYRDANAELAELSGSDIPIDWR
jgi:hypothetical protein